MVLMIKALVLSKSINNGNVTIVELVNYFQVMFNVDLKDHYRKYNEVKNSKEPTKFLDYLIELIEKDIDEGEEKLIKKRIRK
ncbi:MAG: RteC domain-containing protein [Saprospiraceae bacterium]|nr:RteC domain-containing protein [Saprospiraceae bacterium]